MPKGHFLHRARDDEAAVAVDDEEAEEAWWQHPQGDGVSIYIYYIWS